MWQGSYRRIHKTNRTIVKPSAANADRTHGFGVTVRRIASAERRASARTAGGTGSRNGVTDAGAMNSAKRTIATNKVSAYVHWRRKAFIKSRHVICHFKRRQAFTASMRRMRHHSDHVSGGRRYVIRNRRTSTAPARVRTFGAESASRRWSEAGSMAKRTVARYQSSPIATGRMYGVRIASIPSRSGSVKSVTRRG